MTGARAKRVVLIRCPKCGLDLTSVSPLSGTHVRTDSSGVTVKHIPWNGCTGGNSMEEWGKMQIHDQIFRTMLRSYKKAALRRGLDFDLCDDEFFYVTQSACHYCGEEAGLRGRNSQRKVLGFKANGVDRVDNSNGYTKDNVVACCWQCNAAKRSMSAKDFEDWIIRAATHLLGRETHQTV